MNGIERSIADEVPFELPNGWAWCRLGDITFGVGSKENQVQTKDVLPKGDYPVVSQGDAFIDGYYNDRSKVIEKLPLIMFGDHTRNVKYIDFPFIIGADGTKCHHCLEASSRYVYYWMLNIAKQLHNRGYARHYSLLKQQFFPLPPLAEQKRIVAKIEELLSVIEKI